MIMEKKGKIGEKSPLPELDISGLFGGLGEAVNILGKLVETGGQLNRSSEFRVKGLGDKAHGVYGFSIRTLGEAGAKVERFGNVHTSREGFVVDEVREPLIDIFDEGDDITVTAELPGAKEEEISAELQGDVLTIEAKGERSYAKEVMLPCAAKDLSKKYNNGVLTIHLKKQKT
jgi:HSP20 family protein